MYVKRQVKSSCCSNVSRSGASFGRHLLQTTWDPLERYSLKCDCVWKISLERPVAISLDMDPQGSHHLETVCCSVSLGTEPCTEDIPGRLSPTVISPEVGPPVEDI